MAETIRQTIIKARKCLNIHDNRKALILQALIHTNFVTHEALKLNYPEGDVKRDAYYKEILSYFPEGVDGLKKRYKEENSKQ